MFNVNKTALNGLLTSYIPVTTNVTVSRVHGCIKSADPIPNVQQAVDQTTVRQRRGNLKSIFWGLYCFTTYTDILSIHL